MSPSSSSTTPLLLLLVLIFLTARLPLSTAAAEAVAAAGVKDKEETDASFKYKYKTSISPSGDLATTSSSSHEEAASALDAFRTSFLKESMKEQEANPDAQRPYYPACPLYDAIMETPGGCAFLRAARGVLTTLCENVTSTTSSKLPINPTNHLPEVLTDLRPDPPFEVPKALIAHERPTYYWLYRNINNMYNHAARENEEGYAAPLPPVPPGWSQQKTYYIDVKNIRYYFADYLHTPMLMTMWHEERQTMAVVIRGTLSPQEWGFDFEYQFAEGQALQDFPGRVHQGVYNVFVLFKERLLAEVARLNPKHVFVTGHSLGGALTHLAGFKIGMAFPQLRVDAVTFASILVGDEAFIHAQKKTINVRNVFYLGKGWGYDAEGRKGYFVGDLIPQATCGPFHGCPLLGTGERDARYQYAMLGSYVPFYSEDMPNTEEWKQEENLLTPFYRFYVTSHMCSYICWTAQGIDPEARCYFPRQYYTEPGKYKWEEICLVYNPVTQQII